MTITITLPLPTKHMLAQVHAKGNWRARYSATHPARVAARMLATNALGRRDNPRWKRARFSYRFYWGDRRRRDPSNALAACKAIQDGIADAGIVEDDRGVFPSIDGWELGSDEPRLVVVCEEL